MFLYGTEASEKDGGGIITQLAVACSEILTRGMLGDGRTEEWSLQSGHSQGVSVL